LSLIRNTGSSPVLNAAIRFGGVGLEGAGLGDAVLVEW